MPIKRRTLAWLLVLIWIVPVLAFGEVRGKLIGKVVGPDDKGIFGVAVTVTSKELPGFRDVETTDRKGVFEVDFTKIDVTYQYRFDKSGFQTLQTEQKWSLEGTGSFQWTMQPGESAATLTGSGAAPVSTVPEAITAYNAGVTAVKAKDLATAETQFKEAVAHDPNLRLGWGQLASVQVALGHDKDAAEAAEKAMALGSTDPVVLTARWQAYHNLKDETKAAQALQDLDRIGRRTEEAKKIHNEAVALQKAGDNVGALAKFQEAVKIDPNLAVAQLGVATTAFKVGRNEEAVAAAEAILKNEPHNEAAARLRYNACLALKDKTKLTDALLGLAPYEPKIARDGLLTMAFDAYDANNMDLSKAMFAKALQIDPNYAIAYYWTGLIDVGKGLTAEAKTNLERFVQLAPNDKEADSAREMLKYLKP
ncbi:MAG: tetratricopeptide repeat protein [Acidobacteriia bacterium]|nr:tetratricopeptide repeat protein [Terriglobia bacterium]